MIMKLSTPRLTPRRCCGKGWKKLPPPIIRSAVSLVTVTGMMSGVAENQVHESYEGPSRLARLVSSIAERDESALAQLYDETSRIVYGLALRLVRDAAAAEDITLEVFLQ